MSMMELVPVSTLKGHEPKRGKVYRWLWRKGVTPNKITAARLSLVPLVAILLWLSRFFIGQGNVGLGTACAVAALVVFLIAVLTDRLDGELARRSGQITRLGEFLDPTVDKGLVIVTLVMLVWLYRGGDTWWWSAIGLIAAFEVSSTLLRTWILRTRDGAKLAAQWWGKA